MNDRLGRIRQLVATMIVATLLMGCGEWETDPPSPASEKSQQEDASQEVSDDDSEEEIRHPFTTEVTSGSEEIPPEDESSDEGDCAVICFKVLWCQEDVEGLESCVASCEDSRYSNIVTERAFECYREAEGCGEVERCAYELEACTEVCGVYNQCGHFSDGIGCHQWCAGEIWAGRLDWDVQGCVLEAGRANACADMKECGLSPPED